MRRLYLFAAVLIVTLNLRPALVTIGPVLPLIGRTLALSPSALGILTSLPILMLGVASGIAAPFGKRIGWSAGVVVASFLIAAGTIVRSSGGSAALFAGAIVLGAGIGLGNVYVPTLLKWGFAQRLGLMMGIYTFCLTVGAMLSVSLTPAILRAFEGAWRPALGVWAIPAAASTLVWLPLLRLQAGNPAAAPVPLWHSRLAWAVTAYMGFQSMLFYSLASWYGALLQDRGLSLEATSFNLTVFYFVQMIFALILPIALVRTRRQDVVAVLLPGIAALGIAGAFYGPLAAIPLFSATIGLALGGVFGTALSFMVLRARNVQTAARLSGMAQTVGYLMAALGPLGVGFLHEAADPRLATTAWLVALATGTMLFGAAAGKNAYVEDEGELVLT